MAKVTKTAQRNATAKTPAHQEKLLPVAETSTSLKTLGITAKAGSIVRIEPDRIKVVPAYNIRRFNSSTDELGEPKDEADYQLKESIRGNGWIETQPAVVRGLSTGDILLVQGHRRLAAFRELLKEGVPLVGGVPCILEAVGRTDAQRTLDLLTSNTGKPLTSVERGVIFARLRAYGWTDDLISEKAGITTRQVSELCMLAQAEPETVDMIEGGKVSATFVAKLIRAHQANTKRILQEAEKIRAAKEAEKTAAGGKIGERDKTVTAEDIGAAEEALTGETRVGTAPRPAGTGTTRNARDNGDGGKDTGAGKGARDTGKKAEIAGPVTMGQGSPEAMREISDATGEVILWSKTAEIARSVVEYFNQGYHVFKGKLPEASASDGNGASSAQRKAPAKQSAT